jgi:uncharacterized protein YbjT (DUF2867 family)
MTGCRVLLLGATGLTGQHCLSLLLSDERVNEVYVLTRRALNLSHAKLKEYQWTDDLSAMSADVFSVDRVICCLGTTLKKAGSREAFRRIDFTLCAEAARLAKAAGVQVFSIVSAVNADPRGVSYYARVKGELEAALDQLGFPHLILAKPSLLLGERDESRPLETLGQRLLQPLIPVVRKLSPASTPISARLLAQALVNATLQHQTKARLVLRYPELIHFSQP